MEMPQSCHRLTHGIHGTGVFIYIYHLLDIQANTETEVSLMFDWYILFGDVWSYLFSFGGPGCLGISYYKNQPNVGTLRIWDLKTGGLEIPDPCYTHPNPSFLQGYP